MESGWERREGSAQPQRWREGEGERKKGEKPKQAEGERERERERGGDECPRVLRAHLRLLSVLECPVDQKQWLGEG